MAKTGVLLVNLGTPDSPATSDVRRYLREFLSDPRVLDVNPVGRFLLLEAVILPRRPAASSEAYRKVWTKEGSPLLVHGRALTRAVQAKLGGDFEVVLGMRYGNPSLRDALGELRRKGVDEIVVFPLYPHYSSASTGSSLEAVYRLAAELWNTPFLKVVPPFFDHPGFIGAFAEIGRSVMREVEPDHVVFSFHGLPERQIRKSDETGAHCLRSDSCCSSMQVANRNCYRAQCFETARLLAKSLGIDASRHTVSFQSRLGRDPWIRPYTDVLVTELPKRGVKRVAVYCPAFVADCLETLEEIGIRARESFVEAGGQDLRLIPSLNSHPSWIETTAEMVRATAGGC